VTGFNNPVVGALNLVRRAIRSPDFQTGTDGWSIDQDGSAEFNDVTVRGVFSLPSNYRARMTDLLLDPNFATTGAWVEFALGEWDRPTFQTFSNSAVVSVMMEGYNNNTAGSTLRLAHRVYSAPAPVGPWTLEVDFDQANGAAVTNSAVGSTASMQGNWSTMHADELVSTTPTIRALTSDLTARPWIQVRPGWRLSSGGAGTAHFVQARLIVAPSA
jgi:hypothetical protein